MGKKKSTATESSGLVVLLHALRDETNARIALAVKQHHAAVHGPSDRTSNREIAELNASIVQHVEAVDDIAEQLEGGPAPDGSETGDTGTGTGG